MNKLIIENRTKLGDLETLYLVRNVIMQGKISNYGKQYCYVTSIIYGDYEYIITTDLNKKSDRFVITYGEYKGN